MKKNVFRCVLAIVLTIAVLIGSIPLSTYADSAELKPEQQNAVAMLNYITVLTQDIHSSRNNRLYLEDAYSMLVNNILPDAIDALTLEQIMSLLDIMEDFRMIEVWRDRLDLMYEQEQAQAIQNLLPYKLDVAGIMKAFSGGPTVISLLNVVVDSVVSYQSDSDSSESREFPDEWDLNDEEAAILHDSRKSLFAYMVKIVQEQKLPGELTLTEASVDEFVKWKNNDNITSRIHFLESNKNTYKNYGGYWLLLAESYFNNEDYSKCMDSLAAYEALGIHFLRKDHDLARVLPMAVVASDKLYSGAEYEEKTDRFANLILTNTDHDDWQLRFFAANAFIDLYGRSNDVDYLDAAYDIVLDNVNYLVEEQQKLNTEYLQEVQTISLSEGTSVTKMAEIISFNKYLKELRKTELAPVLEPLRLNCDLLFSLAREKNISETEKKKIEGILHPNKAPLFLNALLDAQYWFVSPELQDASDRIVFGGTGVIIPVEYLPEDVAIEVTVREADATAAEIFTDWELTEVKREHDDDISSFGAVFTSEAAKKHTWKPGANINISITAKDENDNTPAMLAQYTSVNVKNKWYDHLKVWEGQNNNWYDYLNVWDVKVNFERVMP